MTLNLNDNKSRSWKANSFFPFWAYLFHSLVLSWNFRGKILSNKACPTIRNYVQCNPIFLIASCKKILSNHINARTCDAKKAMCVMHATSTSAHSAASILEATKNTILPISIHSGITCHLQINALGSSKITPRAVWILSVR